MFLLRFTTFSLALSFVGSITVYATKGIVQYDYYIQSSANPNATIYVKDKYQNRACKVNGQTTIEELEN